MVARKVPVAVARSYEAALEQLKAWGAVKTSLRGGGMRLQRTYLADCCVGMAASGSWRAGSASLMPPHRGDVEPFGGAASVLIASSSPMPRSTTTSTTGRRRIGLMRDREQARTAHRALGRHRSPAPVSRGLEATDDRIERARASHHPVLVGFGSNARQPRAPLDRFRDSAFGQMRQAAPNTCRASQAFQRDEARSPK